MKEMIYSDTRLNTPEMLADGEYKGFHFYVFNLGTHPCAYVDVTDTDLNGKNYESIDIECHCGLTYSSKYLHTVDKNGWFIGWDYAHYCDFLGYELKMPINIRTNGKRWTTAEIVNECKQVIDQLATYHPTEASMRETIKDAGERIVLTSGPVRIGGKVKFCVVCGRRISKLFFLKKTCSGFCQSRYKSGYAPYSFLGKGGAE